MNRLILIDGNNWGFAGMANPRLSSGEKDTQAILSVLKRVRTVYENHPEATIIVLWDGRSWRKDAYSEYKANRVKTEKQTDAISAYIEQKKDIVTGLKLLGVSQASAKNMEADDLAYLLTKNAISKGTPVTLLTADHDWQQLVQRGVQWINVIHDQVCRHATFERDTGYKDAGQFVDAKCVLGDTGDNIKGVHKVGPKALEGVYAFYDRFEDFLNAVSQDKHKLMAEWEIKHGRMMPKALRDIDVDETRAIMARNRLLMDLSTPNRPKPEELKNSRQPLNKAAFDLFCHKNAFRSITMQLDKFVQPFEDNLSVIKPSREKSD